MSVVVSNLAGSVLAEISPVPTCLADLNLQIEKITGIPSTLQKLVKDGEVLTSTGHFPEEAFDVLCIKDETPLYSWDVQGNPDSHHIEVEGAVVRCPNLRTDYCNVLTKEPMRSGLHYYEFVLHKVGDWSVRRIYPQWHGCTACLWEGCGRVREGVHAGQRHWNVGGC